MSDSRIICFECMGAGFRPYADLDGDPRCPRCDGSGLVENPLTARVKELEAENKRLRAAINKRQTI